MQDVTAINMAIHRRRCGHASVELHVLAFAMFKIAVTICSFNCLIAPAAKCHPSNGSEILIV